ncbi:MAG: hypothetical protein IBX61_00095 [Thermoleophilia bacterium]|nr:hypothetical protein [Thermoleophilia bacterium]
MIFSKNFPNRHVIMMMVVIIQLGVIGLLDMLFLVELPLMYVLWLVPIFFALFFLSTAEVVAVALAASMICLTAQAAAAERLSLINCLAIALFGIAAAIAAIPVRRYIQTVNMTRSALEKSPLAHAKFTFPGYSIIDCNSAFEKLSSTMTGPGPKKSLFDAFPRESANQMAELMDEVIASHTETECKELRFPSPGGGFYFW